VKIGLEWLERENLDTGDADKNKALVLSLRNGINKFNEIKERAALFFTDRLTYSEDAAGWIVKEESKILFQKMYDEIDQYPDLTLDDFKVLMKTVQKETGIKGKELWMPVRAAITGLTEGPELPVVISVLGKEKVKKFIKQAIDK
jgi:glutamyl/glutaminyl-tRNA synthetase